MNVLVVYCHPSEQSFNAAIRDAVLEVLAERGHGVRLTDLYGGAFEPVMRREEWLGYAEPGRNTEPVRSHVDDLLWAEAVIFIYPTWWYGLPAMLKGWLERVLVPGFAFEMPTATRGPRPKLRNIRHVVALTTCGATPLMSWLMGQPGRRTLLRAFRSVCHPLTRTRFLAIYQMDSVSEEKRRAHLQRVRQLVAGLWGSGRQERSPDSLAA